MILTGKAEEDFYKSLIENYPVNESDVNKWFLSLYVEFQNALIIDFFDSVGIFISTPPYYMTVEKYNRGFESIVLDEKANKKYEIDNDNDVFYTKQEAQTEAIKKANEIYNQNY